MGSFYKSFINNIDASVFWNLLSISIALFYIVGIFKQVAYGACGTAIGGCVGGPPGALVGGIAGRYLFNNGTCKYILYNLLD